MEIEQNTPEGKYEPNLIVCLKAHKVEGYQLSLIELMKAALHAPNACDYNEQLHDAIELLELLVNAKPQYTNSLH